MFDYYILKVLKLLIIKTDRMRHKFYIVQCYKANTGKSVLRSEIFQIFSFVELADHFNLLD
jgi:hypothetical protein